VNGVPVSVHPVPNVPGINIYRLEDALPRHLLDAAGAVKHVSSVLRVHIGFVKKPQYFRVFACGFISFVRDIFKYLTKQVARSSDISPPWLLEILEGEEPVSGFGVGQDT
jgi:hypothetical protein